MEEVHSHSTTSVFRASFQNMAILCEGGVCTTDVGVAPAIAADAVGAPSSAVSCKRCILWMEGIDTPVRSLTIEKLFHLPRFALGYFAVYNRDRQSIRQRVRVCV